MDTANLFTREELIALRNRARDLADSVINPSWRDAWTMLANAADRLDAMVARSSAHTPAMPSFPSGNMSSPEFIPTLPASSIGTAAVPSVRSILPATSLADDSPGASL